MAGPCLDTMEATQLRTGGNDWLYRDLTGDSALAAKADPCDCLNGMVIAFLGSSEDGEFASDFQISRRLLSVSYTHLTLPTKLEV